MKVTKHIEKSNGKTLFSFEIIPPRKGKNIEELYNNIDLNRTNTNNPRTVSPNASVSSSIAPILNNKTNIPIKIKIYVCILNIKR